VLPSNSTYGSSDGAAYNPYFHWRRLLLARHTGRIFSQIIASESSFTQLLLVSSSGGGEPLTHRDLDSPGGILFKFENSPAEAIPADERNDIVPGRADLRISLTSACNLRCSYCHNEGHGAPWLLAKTSALFANIESLLEVATKYGIKSVKFSGGDPGVYPHLLALLEAIAAWRRRFPSIAKWGICTNGTPFLNREKFEALVRSALDNISIGIDSVDPRKRSKPLSPVGVEGGRLLERFVAPLAQAWTGRFIKLDVVFHGDKRQTLDVIRAGRRLGLNVSVVELNGVMTNVTGQEMRNLFLELIAETAAEFSLEAKLHEPLNEIYLFDRANQTPIKFYQDHCRDRDCGNCRKLHLRVSPTGQGAGQEWGAVPCFLQAQSRIIPLAVDGRMSAERFKDAIRYNGRGPSWFAGTPYESLG
jgi:molybdenum cofactor biosynthesis enzyme MoaA